MNELANKLLAEFEDKEYAHAYMESHVVSRIAAQIHALRKQRKWSQVQLANKANLAQERVSKIESADFDSLTLKTLRKFSEAFDVHLNVEFVPFSEGILDVLNIDPKRLEVRGREEDLKGLRLRESMDGEWKVVKPCHLYVVATVTGPLNVEQGIWQEIPLRNVVNG